MNENQHKITVHVKIIAKNGKINPLIDAIGHYYKETRAEQGCEYSEVLQNFQLTKKLKLSRFLFVKI